VILFDRNLAEPRVFEGDNTIGPLREPGGVAFIDEEQLLVCDTGNRRAVIEDTAGRSGRVVDMPGAWADYYSRPQAVALSSSRWLVSDTPAEALWLIEGGRPRMLPLASAGIAPTGLAWDEASSTLAIGDLSGRVWLVEVGDG
jgi:hypothetical protein